MYETVANHLQEKAIQLRNESDLADAFGRSAFNRYYYSTFLRTREMLEDLGIRGNLRRHNEYPRLLKESVIKILEDALKIHRRRKDEEWIERCKEAKEYSLALSKVIETAKSVRNASDYEPAKKIEFSDERSFKLRDVTIAEAKEWPEKAKNFCELIYEAWAKANAEQ